MVRDKKSSRKKGKPGTNHMEIMKRLSTGKNPISQHLIKNYKKKKNASSKSKSKSISKPNGIFQFSQPLRNAKEKIERGIDSLGKMIANYTSYNTSNNSDNIKVKYQISPCPQADFLPCFPVNENIALKMINTVIKSYQKKKKEIRNRQIEESKKIPEPPPALPGSLFPSHHTNKTPKLPFREELLKKIKEKKIAEYLQSNKKIRDLGDKIEQLKKNVEEEKKKKEKENHGLVDRMLTKIVNLEKEKDKLLEEQKKSIGSQLSINNRLKLRKNRESKEKNKSSSKDSKKLPFSDFINKYGDTKYLSRIYQSPYFQKQPWGSSEMKYPIPSPYYQQPSVPSFHPFSSFGHPHFQQQQQQQQQPYQRYQRPPIMPFPPPPPPPPVLPPPPPPPIQKNQDDQKGQPIQKNQDDQKGQPIQKNQDDQKGQPIQKNQDDQKGQLNQQQQQQWKQWQKMQKKWQKWNQRQQQGQFFNPPPGQQQGQFFNPPPWNPQGQQQGQFFNPPPWNPQGQQQGQFFNPPPWNPQGQFPGFRHRKGKKGSKKEQKGGQYGDKNNKFIENSINLYFLNLKNILFSPKLDQIINQEIKFNRDDYDNEKKDEEKKEEGKINEEKKEEEGKINEEKKEEEGKINDDRIVYILKYLLYDQFLIMRRKIKRIIPYLTLSLESNYALLMDQEEKKREYGQIFYHLNDVITRLSESFDKKSGENISKNDVKKFKNNFIKINQNILNTIYLGNNILKYYLYLEYDKVEERTQAAVVLIFLCKLFVTGKKEKIRRIEKILRTKKMNLDMIIYKLLKYLKLTGHRNIENKHHKKLTKEKTNPNNNHKKNLSKTNLYPSNRKSVSFSFNSPEDKPQKKRNKKKKGVNLTGDSSSSSSSDDSSSSSDDSSSSSDDSSSDSDNDQDMNKYTDDMHKINYPPISLASLDNKY
jgi:hypothetical protein